MLWSGLYVVLSLMAGIILFYGFPLLTRKERGSAPVPKISIIIPARNEEKNLPALLYSIKNQGIEPHEVIVVNDNSIDETARIASANGAHVIDSGPLPEGWLGKPWGCYKGAQEAKGELFIFLDADTFLEPDGLERIIENYHEGNGVISIFPYHRIKRHYEVFSAIFNLMQLAGMCLLSLAGKRPKGLFGPSLVISAKEYAETEGHMAVKDQVLEHYAMGEILKKQGIPINLFRGKGVLNVRMYPDGLISLIKGWRKSFALGAGKTPPLNMRLAILWISGIIAATAFLIFNLFSGNNTGLTFGCLLYLFCALHIFILLRRIGNFPVWSGLFYPVILIFFLSLFSVAAISSINKRPVEWKGRKIN